MDWIEKGWFEMVGKVENGEKERRVGRKMGMVWGDVMVLIWDM